VYAFFVPFGDNGLYAGAGAGYMYSSYTFPDEGKTFDNFLAYDFSAGFIFKNGITVAYTLRTNFDALANKFAIGYSYRFK